MHTFQLDDLARAQAEGGRLYHEFLRQPSLSVGLYVLPAGSLDPQGPHSEDEVYYVVSGRGKFVSDGQHMDAQPGAVLFVPAHSEHRFYAIAETLTILVFFAPAEGSLAG